jgi:hypothetical protein
MKNVIIAGSWSLREKWLERKQWRENKGYEVLNYPKEIQSDDDVNINQEYKNLYVDFFEDLQGADILFLMNEDKKWIEWYIGAESFAELWFTNANNVLWKSKTGIFIMQMPAKNVWCYEEIELFLKLDWIKILDKNKF